MNKPLYEHDCDLCVSLGSYREHDLYYHQYKDRPLTVVARYSNYGPDYISGMCFATKGKNNSVPVLYEAKKRAIKLNLYKEENENLQTTVTEHAEKVPEENVHWAAERGDQRDE